MRSEGIALAVAGTSHRGAGIQAQTVPLVLLAHRSGVSASCLAYGGWDILQRRAVARRVDIIIAMLREKNAG